MLSNRRRLRFESLEPRRVLNGAVVAAQTVFVNIPDNLTGEPGGQVVAPVNIATAAGIRGAEIRINYDTTLLDASEASVTVGSVWPPGPPQDMPPYGTLLVVNVDDTTGSIVAFVATAEALGAGGGSLLNVQFAIRNEATVGGSTVVDLAQVRLNEGAIEPTPAPIPGPDPTDGRITFVSPGDEGSIAGFVYADTNVNNQPDQFEGIPRVKITLVNTDTGQQRETFTLDDGSYVFPDVAAGPYQILQRQPAAFLDGGPNEISVTLAGGQSLTDQNFRERGLRPEFVYNRLFTTTALPVGSANWISVIRRIVIDADTQAGLDQTVSASTLSAANGLAAQSTAPVGTAAQPASQDASAVAIAQTQATEEPATAATGTTPGNVDAAAALSAASAPLESSQQPASSPAQAAATVSVVIPDNLTGQPGGVVVAPVNVDNAAGIRRAEIEIHYDPALLQADEAGVTAGPVWPQGAQVAAQVDNAAGSIVAVVTTAEPLDAGGGSLLDVRFAIASNPPVGGSTVVDLARLSLNDGTIVADPEPVLGPQPTDGRVTFVSSGDTAGIAGVESDSGPSASDSLASSSSLSTQPGSVDLAFGDSNPWLLDS